MMKRNRLIIQATVSALMLGMIMAAVAMASPVHRKGCEFPYPGVEVCWEATAGLGTSYAPFDELHMLPIARAIAGQEEILEKYTRDVFRQLLPGNLAEYLVPEWTPVYNLEQALKLSREGGWPAVVWISPRALKNSSTAGPGVVDWDVYFLARGQLVRNLRIRVSSKPLERDDMVEKGVTMGTLMASSGAVASGGLGGMAVVMGTANAKPPEAGQPIELMTELATRQLLFLAQYPIEALNLPGQPLPPRDDEPAMDKVHGWFKKTFAAK
ncbi:MAG: hypothetical protein HW380_2534 [Magnetococcales bacterium]|nr:hypothetical protein [Magnetococcales bacterium]HIJ82951.1 hypothetical protein [Magnetococcales bacterium]